MGASEPIEVKGQDDLGTEGPPGRSMVPVAGCVPSSRSPRRQDEYPHR